MAAPLIVTFGDSINVGIGVGDARDTGMVTTPNRAVKFLSHYALGVGPPQTFFDFPAPNTLGPVDLYAPGNGQSMGAEISMADVLAAALVGVTPAIVKVGVSGSTLGIEWDPDGGYPAPGAGNLYNLALSQVRGVEAQGYQTAAVVNILGTNDAALAATANAFQSNVARMNARQRADFGASCGPIWVLPSIHTANDFLGPVRAGLIAAAAADPQMVVVEYDDCDLLLDGLHPTTRSYTTLGQRIAAAALRLMNIAPQPLARVGSWGVSWAPGASGSTSGGGSISPTGYGAAQVNDLELLYVATGFVNGAIPDPTSSVPWTQAGNLVRSVASGVTEQLAVYSRPVTAAMLVDNNGHTAPTTIAIPSGGTTAVAAKIVCVSGPNPNLSVEAVQPTAPDVFGTGPTPFAALNTSSPNDLVLLFAGGFCGSSGTMSATNGVLANFTKLQDSAFVIVSDREILTVFGGALAAPGSSGAWQVSSSNSMVPVGLAIAVKSSAVAPPAPPSPAPVPPPAVANPGATGALEFVFDPITRDLIDSPDGWFVEGTDSRSTVLWQLESRYQAWWGSPFDGSRIAEIISGDDPATPQDLRDEVLRAMQALVDAGIVSDLAVALDTDEGGRVVIILNYRDRASGRLVDLAYVPFGGG